MHRNRNRFRFRRHRSRTPGKLPPWGIVCICLGSAVLLALIIGNLLHFFLDDEALKQLQSGKEEPPTSSELPERTVPAVQAYPHTLGDRTDRLNGNGELPPMALSVSLNTPDGELLYTSAVAKLYGSAPQEAPELNGSLQELYTSTTVSYISGVFYPQAPKQETPDLFYAVAAQEAALLREFANAGGSELLLVGLSFAEADLNTTLEYIKQIKAALGEIPFGLAVPFSAAATARGWELLPLLAQNAAYLALDLQAEADTDAATLLQHSNYYLVSYQMRLLLDDTQTELINAASATLSDLQILTSVKAPEPPSEETAE